MQTGRLIAACLAALLAIWPAAAQAPASPLDDPTGFWLVAERGPPVNEALANIPILGANLRPRIGNPRAVWDIRREGDGYAIEIRPRGLIFKPARLTDGVFTGEAADPDNPQGRVRLEARIAEGRLTGKLVYADFELMLQGAPPESVEALRQAYAMTRARLDEFEGPYALPEIERLRAENLVLIERIRRVEGELQARSIAPPPPRPAQLAPPAASQSASVPRAGREIQIAFPAWDPGRAGRRMTVAEPGFVSLVGRVRADAALMALRISDAQVVFNADGSFTAVVEVPREGRRVRIDASFAQGPGATLEFDVAIGPRPQ
ncbi:MAG: hypothetical protein ACKO1J_15825 [Tagaea sp.]